MELAEILVELGCTVLGESDTDAAICDQESTHKLEEFASGQFKIVNADAGAYYRNESGPTRAYVRSASVSAGALDTSFYTEWRDLETREAHVAAAVAASGGIATLEKIGESFEGRPINAVRLIGKGWKPGMPRVVLTHQLHAREWISGMAGIYTVESTIAKVKADPSWIAGMEIVIVPMVNPDGFFFSAKWNRLWRKNRNTNNGHICGGVDLNRNFDPAWGEPKSATGIKCLDIYYGTGPFSEPESKTVKNLIDEAPVGLFLDVHSFSELLLAPWSHTGELHPRRADIDVVGHAMQDAVESVHGHRYTYGGSEVLYEAAGVLSDYATSTGAFGFTYELRPTRFPWLILGFAPPASMILPTAEEFFAGFLAGVEWAKAGGPNQ